jgi:hypothetical protein
MLFYVMGFKYRGINRISQGSIDDFADFLKGTYVVSLSEKTKGMQRPY